MALPGACNSGGDVIAWVMKTHGVSFRHAVELLRDDHPALFTATLAAGDGRVVRKEARVLLASPVTAILCLRAGSAAGSRTEIQVAGPAIRC